MCFGARSLALLPGVSNGVTLCVLESIQSRPTLCDPMAVAARLLNLWDTPGKNPGVGSRALLQGIFPAEI